jgi:dTDP-4-dehydrorhamnose reductase
MACWLVTGAGGMLGQDMVALLEQDGETALALTRQDLDITDQAAVTATVLGCRPDFVVNCAAWTAVDEAEAHEDRAFGVNGRGARLVAAACAASGARLIHMSTDYVFAGDARRPYGEHDRCGPRTAYGRTKLAGERAVAELLPGSGYIVRAAWLYGAHGRNFVRTMMRLERDGGVVDVVDDQRGQPTWAMDVAGQVIALARSGAPAGVYHATSAGETTWFGFAREIFRLLGADPARVRPVTSGAYPRPAPRPAYSVLGHGAWASAGLTPIPGWRLRLPEGLRAVAAA